MAVATVKLTDELTPAANTAAASTGRLRNEMGQFVKGAQGMGAQTTSMSTKMTAFDKSTAKMGKSISNLNFSGLGDFFAKGALQGKGMTDMIGGLAGAVDPVTLAIKAFTIECEVLIGVAVGATVALGGMMLMAINVTQASTQFANTMQALTGDGKATVAMISSLTAALPQSASQIKSWATELAKTGMKGKELETAIKAVASSDAIMRDGGAGATALLKRLQQIGDTTGKVKFDKRFLNMLESSGVTMQDLAAQTGKSVEELNKMGMKADDVQKAVQNILIKKGKGPLEDMALEWGSISAKLTGGLRSVFADPAIAAAVKPFMMSVKELFGTFNKGAAGTSLLGSVVKGILVPAFHGATAAIKVLHLVVSTLVNWFLRAAIAFNSFKKTAAGAAIIKGLLIAIGVAAAVIGVVMLVIGGIVVAVVGLFLVALLAIPVAIGLVVAAFAGIVAAIVYVGGAVLDFAINAGAALANWASGAVSAASNFIGGLVDGIRSGTGMVIDAITSLAGSAVGALKSALGIHSPSAVMKIQGKFTGAGMAEGLKASAHGVAQAANQMGGAAATGSASGASSGQARGGGGGKSVSVVVQPGAIVISGAGSSGEALSLTETAVSILFERYALEAGR